MVGQPAIFALNLPSSPHYLPLHKRLHRELTAVIDEFSLDKSTSPPITMTAINSTSMHFGPEWMRPKPRAQALPSPPLSTAIPTSGNSTYSAQVSPATGPSFKERDEAHPFRYTKEELLNIYKDGGGKAGLGLEVERWEGVVRELEGDPVSLREINEAERKVSDSRINSELPRVDPPRVFLLAFIWPYKL